MSSHSTGFRFAATRLSVSFRFFRSFFTKALALSRHRPAQSPVLELPKEQKVKLQCFDDMVLVLPDKQSETTPGGIVLPEIAREQGAELRYGKVVCVGPGK